MAHRAPLVLLQSQDGLAAHIAVHDIIITAPSLRISVHHYNHADEVVQLLDCLKTFPAQH